MPKYPKGVKHISSLPSHLHVVWDQRANPSHRIKILTFAGNVQHPAIVNEFGEATNLVSPDYLTILLDNGWLSEDKNHYYMVNKEGIAFLEMLENKNASYSPCPICNFGVDTLDFSFQEDDKVYHLECKFPALAKRNSFWGRVKQLFS